MRKKTYTACSRMAAIFLAAALMLTGCGTGAGESSSTGSKETQTTEADDIKTEGQQENDTADTEETDDAKETESTFDSETSYLTDAPDAPEVSGLNCQGKLKLDYAECYDVYYYENDYQLIDVHDSAQYLLVPEGAEAPEGLDDSIIVLQKPLDKIYLAASSTMALFRALDSMDNIKMSGIDASGWYIEEAKQAMEDGKIQFAGKYSEPDYEMLVDQDCDVAIESTMILHTPKVQEMIEDLDIPVFIDRSSYETHPLARTEWIKLYGAMLDKEEEAYSFFDEQAKVIGDLKDFKNTEKTVAFFFVSTDGSIVVRRTQDYIPSMIELAGGRYVFQDLDSVETTSASVSMSMEEFYAAAADADYLVYNATIDNPIQSVDELVAKNELFEDFKAVQEGNVWCVGKYMYQATDIVGQLITDFHLMLTDGDEKDMTFLTKVSDK
ncbi:ABC transporter substrate-binding protein [Blautia sp. BX19]|nr:ABC transporter substrate-binding protein [Blautia tarda]